MFDRETGRSRGFGFVTYSDPEVAHWVIRQGSVVEGVGRLEMRGKVCEVKLATPRSSAPGPFLGSRRQNARRDFRDPYLHLHQPPYGGYHRQQSPYYPDHAYGYGAFPSTPGYVDAGGYGGGSYHQQAYHLQYLHPHPSMQQYMTPEEASMMLSYGGPPPFTAGGAHPGTSGYTSVMKTETPGLPTKSSSTSTPPSLEDTEGSDDGQGGGRGSGKDPVTSAQRSFEQLQVNVDR